MTATTCNRCDGPCGNPPALLAATLPGDRPRKVTLCGDCMSRVCEEYVWPGLAAEARELPSYPATTRSTAFGIDDPEFWQDHLTRE